MNRLFLFISLVCLAIPQCVTGQWLSVTNVRHQWEQSEMGGPVLTVNYRLDSPEVAQESPAYVFFRFRTSPNSAWSLVSTNLLRGSGHGLVFSPGQKASKIWGFTGIAGTNAPSLEIKVQGVLMAPVPAGLFRTKTIPGGGYDASKQCVDPLFLSAYYIQKNEVTFGMYADFLNGLSDVADAWHPKMSDPLKGGIEQFAPGRFRVMPGRDNHPAVYVNWYNATTFLETCGLRLPTEAEWEKSFRGGVFLDGDLKKQRPNPYPERMYPWGNEAPDQGGVFRCNIDGDSDGYPHTAPVGSFSNFASPYGINDLAGNAAEWTLDWYATSYHAGLDGFRILRGGSYLDPAAGVDAISAPTSLPIKKSSIMGFRGVFAPSVKSNDSL